MSTKLEKTSVIGVYRRGRRFVVLWRDGNRRQRWTTFRSFEDACEFKFTITPLPTSEQIPPAIETDRGYETACLIWQKVGGHGYAADEYGRRVHWIIYERVYGPIPDGYDVRHRCQQRDCVNPRHLVALSPTEHAAEHTGLEGARKGAGIG